MKRQFTMTWFLIPTLCLLLKISFIAAEPHPDCVPPTFLAACKQAKCVGNQLQNCETLVSAYPGGTQCCNQNTLKELKRNEAESRFRGWANGKDGKNGKNGWFGSNGQNGGHGGKRKKRQAYNFDSNPSAKWSSPIILYINSINSDSYIDNIKNAVAHIEDKTCLKFVFSNTPPTTDHIVFNFHTEGCASFVGKALTTASPIIGDETCYSKPGNIISLLAQTLGLWQLTQRPDRNLYVKVMQENLMESHKADFQTVNKAFISTSHVYDHASITQLPALAYSSNGRPTILPEYAERLLTMGQRVELSYSDAKKLNKLYCSEECPEVITCNKGGYQDPSNCSACVCPEGFGGVNCTLGVTAKTVLTKNDCGGVLEATMTPAYLTSPGYDQGNYPENIECQWIIKAPGGKVNLTFVGDFEVYADEMSVCQNWVEVKYRTPLSALGTRFCGSRVPFKTLSASLSEIVVVFKSNNVGKSLPSQKGFRLSYTLVDFKPCKVSPCKNGGECLTTQFSYKCICPNNFTGPNCEIDLRTTLNQCNFNPCRNKGTCEQVSSINYTCSCLTGFYGDRCEKANCGGCENHSGINQKQCSIGFTPPRNCTAIHYRWQCNYYRDCRKIAVEVVKECVKEEVCCDNTVKIRNRCASLGWTRWNRCSRECGGGYAKRYKYGLTEGNYRIVDSERMRCNTKPCERRTSTWPKKWYRKC